MKRYAIYAGEQMYGGLHGMCEHCVVEAINFEDARDTAITKTYEVMESYSDIYESIEERVEEYTTYDMTEEDVCSLREELMNENMDYCIREIDESKAKDISTNSLDNMYYNDPEGFIKEYCIEI